MYEGQYISYIHAIDDTTICTAMAGKGHVIWHLSPVVFLLSSLYVQQYVSLHVVLLGCLSALASWAFMV